MVCVKGEKRLLAGILQRAILDAAGATSVITGDERKRAFQYILRWEGTFRPAPFTFPWICEHLNQDPYLVRCNLIRLIRHLRRNPDEGRNMKGLGYSYHIIDRIFEEPAHCVNLGRR